MRVALIDAGTCNLSSIRRALEECGGEPFVPAGPADLGDATHLVLPGVGSFAVVIDRLAATGFKAAIRDWALVQGLPVLGICLGMQLLAGRGTEGGEREGLGLIPGAVVRLVPGSNERIPHVGWNDVLHDGSDPLFAGIASGTDFYFVHSYHLAPENPGDAIATTPHGGGFASVVRRGRVYGVQFHPEKSQRAGFRLLRNFLEVGAN